MESTAWGSNAAGPLAPYPATEPGSIPDTFDLNDVLPQDFFFDIFPFYPAFHGGAVFANFLLLSNSD